MQQAQIKHLLLESLKKYYANTSHIERIVDIVDGKSTISLRLIDWYVTNYCKINNIVLLNKSSSEYFNVYMNYRAQLKAFKKVQFDPFRRRDRIMYEYSKGRFLNTTIGQLNFFRWALENDILEHIEQDLTNIEKDMFVVQKNIEDEDLNAHSAKSSIKNMTTFNGSAVISFE
jgi:hypothetical protein